MCKPSKIHSFCIWLRIYHTLYMDLNPVEKNKVNMVQFLS